MDTQRLPRSCLRNLHKIISLQGGPTDKGTIDIGLREEISRIFAFD